jgi:hypothetical protein
MSTATSPLRAYMRGDGGLRSAGCPTCHENGSRRGAQCVPRLRRLLKFGPRVGTRRLSDLVSIADHLPLIGVGSAEVAPWPLEDPIGSRL